MWTEYISQNRPSDAAVTNSLKPQGYNNFLKNFSLTLYIQNKSRGTFCSLLWPRTKTDKADCNKHTHSHCSSGDHTGCIGKKRHHSEGITASGIRTRQKGIILKDKGTPWDAKPNL